MKSTLNTKPQNCVEHTFPALYKSTKSDLVVLANGIETGTVVFGSTSEGIKYKTGYYSSCWIDFDDESEWHRLPAGSSVTLTQE